MRTLRGRLTLSAAVPVALTLILVAIALNLLAFAFVVRSTTDAVARSVRLAETIAAERRNLPYDRLTDEIVRRATTPGAAIVPVPLGPNVPPPPRHGATRINLLDALGLQTHIVPVGKGYVVVLPDLNRIDPELRLFFVSLVLSLVAALAISWRVGRWIADQAIAPLITVTRELRRFASGDFTPRAVDTPDRAELGSLIDAYNGAAAQVAAAFAERMRVDEHMRRFVAEAGHELRTPLTVIAGYVDILKAGGADDLTIRDGALNTLALETHRMRGLVERLMALARLERPDAAQPVVVKVDTLAARVISHLTAARGGHVALDSDGGAAVVADPTELYEAISNLVDNALKYGEGTPVRVEVVRSNGTVTVRVRDAGPGIPEPERPHIFERFYRGEGRGDVDGSGLGLAIVERAVARCGGTVRLERAEPGQTTFALEMPSAPEQ